MYNRQRWPIKSQLFTSLSNRHLQSEAPSHDRLEQLSWQSIYETEAHAILKRLTSCHTVDTHYPLAFISTKNANECEVETDTQRGVLPGLSQERNLRSKIWWFTEFCNSHYVSHFAAFFIVARTKISIAKSCILCYLRFKRTNELVNCHKVLYIR